MAMDVETAKRVLESHRRMGYIREFANKMGYTIHEGKYETDYPDRTYYFIELVGTCDNEGEPFCWMWDMNTWEER